MLFLSDQFYLSQSQMSGKPMDRYMYNKQKTSAYPIYSSQILWLSTFRKRPKLVSLTHQSLLEVLLKIPIDLFVMDLSALA